MEEIAAGSLAVMVRLALADPDAEFWPYRIDVGGHIVDGDAIVALDQQLRRPTGTPRRDNLLPARRRVGDADIKS
ncbi:hypothetical protein IAG41_08465 [Sphingomonas sp. JC676]|uniref:hypothetical protein n=1 Tax=Sphingomonas sp. JC676 TaxID=2768065 RepID=UPI001657702B|nr:hypothetical protein [Sphingomonas sp. JC676]MBC9032421.1 hypothetical protein [Sphingomonas sp. JC676]